MLELCPRLQEIADRIGEENAILLADLFGGTYLWVSSKGFSEDHPINNMSKNSISALVAEYGGHNIFIPKGSKWRKAARNLSIISDRANGLSVREVALKHKVNQREVYRISAQFAPVI